MVDYVEIPIGWRFAASNLGNLYMDKRAAYRSRKKGINPNHSDVVGVLIWNHRNAEADVLLHPSWVPTGDAGGNVNIRQLVLDSISILNAHIDYADQLEDKQDGKNNE